MLLSGIDFLMRLIVIERSSSPASWFADEPPRETEKTNSVTWLQLLRQPRLIVSLLLTSTVATVMSAFEVIETIDTIAP